jgi:hypothetical protein
MMWVFLSPVIYIALIVLSLLSGISPAPTLLSTAPRQWQNINLQGALVASAANRHCIVDCEQFSSVKLVKGIWSSFMKLVGQRKKAVKTRLRGRPKKCCNENWYCISQIRAPLPYRYDIPILLKRLLTEGDGNKSAPMSYALFKHVEVVDGLRGGLRRVFCR